MSRHLEILRKAKLDAELFAPSAGCEGPREARSSGAAADRTPWGGGHRNHWQQLVHELFLHSTGQARAAVGLAAATAGEGTSYVASHLAAELARSTGLPALLLEANLHRPSQAKRHGVEPDPGLRHILLDRSFPLDSCLRQTAIESLWLLPAGSAPNGSSGPPDWTCFHSLFEGLRRRFAGIVADLPPVNLSADTSILGPLFDGLVLVVEADLCSREVIQNAVVRLQRANPNLLGTVLNKRKFFVPEPLYRRL